MGSNLFRNVSQIEQTLSQNRHPNRPQINPKSTPNRPQIDPKSIKNPSKLSVESVQAPKWAPGLDFDVFWGPQNCPAPPGNPKKTSQDQRTRENEGAGDDTKTREKYEYVVFSLFSVLCSSGRHFERPGVPQGPILDAPGTSKIVFSLR